VIYNMTVDRLRPMIEQSALRHDADLRLVGEAVQMPRANVHFLIETSPTMRNVSLVATSAEQSHTGWKRLRQDLAAAIRTVEVAPSPRGFTLLAVGILLLGWPLSELLRMPGHVVAERLKDMLRL
jgi:hypothetical protein